jgi:hypothetical protein
MTRAFNRNLLLCILSLSALVLLVGCSMDSASVAPQSSSDQSIATSNAVIPSDGPAPGYKFIKSQWGLASSSNGTLDDPNWFASRALRADQGGMVVTHNIGCNIPNNALPYNMTITVNVPVPGEATVEYGPHPTQFNAPVQLFFDYNTLILPPGTHIEDLVVFYQEDSGAYDLIGGYIDYTRHLLVAYTNHFSRYIISVRTEM